jgi:hypothetical protein
METYKLSDHFTLPEAVYSTTAKLQHLNNVPSASTVQTMKQTAFCMERVRAALGNLPLHINSWYRSPEVNAAVGSKSTSQHILGEAVDFICPEFGSCVDICKKLIELKDLIRYDQLILEHTWVHISFAILSTKPRGQVLSLLATGAYSIGLTDKQGHPL